MGEDKLIQVYVNPLQFLEVDEPWAGTLERPADECAILRFLVGETVDHDRGAIIERYREVSGEARRLYAAPAERKILDKLVWPLRNAKGSYMVANYLGTIALCGMVGEMVAILCFEIATFEIDGATVHGRDLTADQQKRLWGSAYERMGQKERVRTLKDAGLLEDSVKAELDGVRDIRNRYLHFFTQDHARIQQDAARAYGLILSIVVRLIGQDLNQGKIRFNSALVAYLDEHGLTEPADPS
jgi:hypothetical protein